MRDAIHPFSLNEQLRKGAWLQWSLRSQPSTASMKIIRRRGVFDYKKRQCCSGGRRGDRNCVVAPKAFGVEVLECADRDCYTCIQ